MVFKQQRRVMMMTKPISNDRKVRRSRSVGRGAGTADVLLPLAFVCGAIAMFIAGLPGIGWLIVAVGVMASVAVVSRCSPKFRWGPLLMVALVPLLSGVAVAPVAQADAPGNFPGWTRDYVDDFNAPLDVTKWGRYESSTNQSGMLSEYDLANVYTTNGSMVLKTYNAGGTDWRAGGVSGARGFSASQGKWTMRAKFDRAYGIGYAFLLYPKGGSWPPEVDIAEGTAGGPRVMSTLHWSPTNLTDSRFKYGLDMTQWHTYGVILTDNKVEFTVDGGVWTTINNAGSPTVPMWIGFQTGAKAPSPTATGELVDSTTPQTSNIYIDWVAHWKAI